MVWKRHKKLSMKLKTLFSNSLLALVIMVGLTLQPLQAVKGETIVVYGASGKIGGVIVDVALERGYNVIGISRDPGKLKFEHESFSGKKGDLMDVNSVRELSMGVAAIVISVSSVAEDNRPENSLVAHAANSMVRALSGMGNLPYIVQIGAASLMYGSTWEEITGNMQHAPFPLEPGSPMYGGILGHQLALETYRISNLRWTIVAPPMTIIGFRQEGGADPTLTKETYRTSTAQPVRDADGGNSIYVRDLARAAIDEIEKKQFVGQVFTVGY